MIRMKNLKIYLICTALALGTSSFASVMLGPAVKMLFLLVGIVALLVNDPVIRLEFRSNIRSKNMSLMIMFLIVMAILGVITGGNPVPVILDFMASFFFFFFFFYKSKTEESANILAKYIEVFFICITLFELYEILSGTTWVVDEDEERLSTLVVCPFFLAMIYLNKGKTALSLLFFAILCYGTIRSIFRINLLFIVLYIIFFLYSLFRNKSLKVYQKVFFTLVFAAGITYSIPLITAYFENDIVASTHLVMRTERLFDSSYNQEEVRKNTNSIIIERFEDFILPQGIGWSNHTKKIMSKYTQFGVYSTMDSNLLYCCYHYGIIIGLYIIILIFLRSILMLLNSAKHLGDSNAFLALCLVLAVVSMFTVKSWIFVHSSYGLTYGLIFAFTNNLKRFSSYNSI